MNPSNTSGYPGKSKDIESHESHEGRNLSLQSSLLRMQAPLQIRLGTFTLPSRINLSTLLKQKKNALRLLTHQRTGVSALLRNGTFWLCRTNKQTDNSARNTTHQSSLGDRIRVPKVGWQRWLDGRVPQLVVAYVLGSDRQYASSLAYVGSTSVPEVTTTFHLIT